MGKVKINPLITGLSAREIFICGVMLEKAIEGIEAEQADAEVLRTDSVEFYEICALQKKLEHEELRILTLSN